MTGEFTEQRGALRQTQTWMQKALLDPRGVNPDELARQLAPSDRLNAAQRLGVYQRSYILRLCKCLAEQFPALCRALGADLFDRFAREYLAEMPSDSHTLYELGRRFPQYLQDNRPDRDLPEEEREDWIDFMVDLVTYERQLFVMFDAPGHEGRSWPDAETLDRDLVLQPCFALGLYRYPVAAYYHRGQDEPGPEFPRRMDSYVALARRDFLTTTYPITELHHRFLQTMLAENDVDRALEQVAKTGGLPFGVVKRSWQTDVRNRWIEAGFFVHRRF